MNSADKLGVLARLSAVPVPTGHMLGVVPSSDLLPRHGGVNRGDIAYVENAAGPRAPAQRFVCIIGGCTDGHPAQWREGRQ